MSPEVSIQRMRGESATRALICLITDKGGPRRNCKTNKPRFGKIRGGGGSAARALICLLTDKGNGRGHLVASIFLLFSDRVHSYYLFSNR